MPSYNTLHIKSQMLDKMKKWTFDDANIDFDEHVKSSIPLYEETHKLISFISTFFLKNNSIAYEIGCSTGNLLHRINNYNKDDSIQYYGIEPSKKLFNIATKNNTKPNINFINSDVQEVDLLSCDLMISHFMLQFVPHEQRTAVLDKMYNALKPKGAFIFFEKSHFDNPKFDHILTSVFNYDFKLSKGFNIDEIYEKAYSLRSVMDLHTETETAILLKSTSFKEIETIFKWGQFSGYICIK